MQLCLFFSSLSLPQPLVAFYVSLASETCKSSVPRKIGRCFACGGLFSMDASACKCVRTCTCRGGLWVVYLHPSVNREMSVCMSVGSVLSFLSFRMRGVSDCMPSSVLSPRRLLSARPEKAKKLILHDAWCVFCELVSACCSSGFSCGHLPGVYTPQLSVNTVICLILLIQSREARERLTGRPAVSLVASSVSSKETEDCSPHVSAEVQTDRQTNGVCTCLYRHLCGPVCIGMRARFLFLFRFFLLYRRSRRRGSGEEEEEAGVFIFS